MRWTFPQDRLVYSYHTGSPLYPVVSGTPFVVYTDQAGTVPASIQDLDGNPVTNATLFIGDDTLIPQFLGPDGVTELWGLPSGAPATYRLEADFSDRLDQIEATQSVDVSTLVLTTDARLSNARTPLAHVATHKSGGTDALAPIDIGAAPVVHTHTESDVTGLVSDLSNKAARVHTHAQTDITGLATSLGALQAVSAKGQTNGYASLDSGGKVPTAQLPTSVTTPPNLTGYQLTSAKGAVNGYASLGSDGKVPTAQLPTATAPGIHSINGLTGTSVTLTLASLGGITSAALANYQATSAKGQPSGYAGLDSAGKVPSTQLPAPPSLANYVQTTDTRLSNARTPTAHAASHHTGGTDVLTPSSIGAAATAHTHQQTDIVNLQASLNLRPTTAQADVRYVQISTKGQASGVASLDGTAKIPAAQIPDLSGTYVSSAALVNYQNVSGKAHANGYASLDATTKIPVAQIPDLSGTYVSAAALTGYQQTSAKGQASGYAGLDSGGKIAASIVPDLSGTAALTTALAAYQLVATKGQANGYAALDGSAKVPTAQIPNLASTYVVQGDSRLTDARTPVAHAASHASGGTDAVTPAAIGAAAVSALGNYQLLSGYNQPSGYAGLDTNGLVAVGNLPIIVLNPGDDIPPDLPPDTIIVWNTGGSSGGGVPAGGTTGQVEIKNSSTDFDVSWHTLTAADVGALTEAAGDARYLTSVNGHTGGDVVITASELNAVLVTDTRLTDSRVPLAHAASHASGGSDPVTPAAIGALTQTAADARYLQSAPVTSVNSRTGVVTLTAADLGAITQTQGDARYLQSAPVASVNGHTGVIVLAASDVGALASTDPSITNARTPTAHASTHAVGGSDPVTPAAIGALSSTIWRRRDLPAAAVGDAAYSGAAPTITTTQQSTSTISGAQALIAPDVGPFNYQGASNFQYGTGSPWSSYYSATSKYPHTYVPNISWSQLVWAVEFGCDAQLLEIKFAAADVTNIAIQVFVDDQKLTDLPQNPGTWGGITLSAGFGNVLKIDLGSVAGAKARKWRVQFFNCPFGGIFLPGTATIWKTSPRGGRLIGYGDSLTDGSGGDVGQGLGTWLYRAARILGVSDVWDQAKGGTGYTVAGTSDTLPNRVAADVAAYAPDRVIIWGGFNDQPGSTQAAIAAAADTTFAALKAISSKPSITVIGCYSPTGTPAGSVTSTDNTLQARAAAAGLPFISPVTGNVYDATGTLIDSQGAWITAANATTYVIQSGGNSPHPNDAGHAYLARRITAALTRLMPY